MRMRDVLWQIWLNCGYFLTVAASGFFLYKLCAPFVRPRNGRFWRVLLFLTLAGSTGMVIWIGDPNLLYTLPAFFALFLLSTRGDRIGRVAVCIILFCLEMSVCALLDTYVERINRNALYDVLVRLARPLVFGPLWLLLRRRLPRDLPVADMDLCALLGNALDNAIEGSRGAGERRITIRCKADKGLFMLRVENTLGGAVQPDLATTKTDKAAHGFGIPGMREIAERYGGTLDAGVRDNGFELVVCLPLAGQAETL